MTLFAVFAVAAVLLVAPIYIVYKPPHALIRYFQNRWPDVLFYVPTTKKVVALTIDDAPSEYTDEILDILKANEVKATLFVIGGQVSGREAALQRLVEHGHELGNHAMHDEPSRSLNNGELIIQLGAVQNLIAKAYEAAEVEQPEERYFRPGSGFFNSAMRQTMKDLNYRTVLGGIYPHDPQIPYASVNARHILSMIRPGGIIICHDRRPWTAPMLRIVLPELKRRGYQVVTVTDLLEVAV